MSRTGTSWSGPTCSAKHGHAPAKFRPSGRARLLAALGRWFGPNFLLPMLLEEEGREVKAYLDMHRETPRGAPGGPEALTLARESAEHATTLGEIAGKGGEPWHKTESGGFLRNVVYGFNDGLTANFGLVAGVIGAGIANQHETVVVAGVAGLIADALSMGSSGYLASKSEREVYEYEIAMEKIEVELMPEIERDELALIYEAKGMDRGSAHTLATQMMADPEQMLKEQVQEELKIGEFSMSPLREGWVTGLATAFGAAIPVFPFLDLAGHDGDHGLVHHLDAFALCRRRGEIRVHRPQRLPLRLRHVRRWRRSRRGWVLRRRVGRSADLARGYAGCRARTACASSNRAPSPRQAAMIVTNPPTTGISPTIINSSAPTR